jgi:DNA (cytosine-5)-methyltransferase 1
MLQASGSAWVIENVANAPLVDPVMLCGSMFPNLKIYRHRLFECSFRVDPPPHPKHSDRACQMGRPPREADIVHAIGNFSGVQAGREAMGMTDHWMTGRELAEAVPPAFAEFVGRAAIAAGL